MSSFHLCKQKDSMQCGIACPSMICSYYNKEYSVDTLIALPQLKEFHC
jgi:ABC-type bacteriocin/lantibiotic exporter with double-glycine peptidase domain